MQPKQQETTPRIRWMIRTDLPTVLNIEIKSFDTPWEEKEFILALQQRNIIGMVIEQNKKVIGFMLYELCKKKLHLLNLAVLPTERWKGVGKTMIRKLISKLSSTTRTAIDLEVRETNLDAQLFFHHCGFRAVEVLRKWYDDTEEDAYRFEFTTEERVEETAGVSD